jgi:hypothetical protein
MMVEATKNTTHAVYRYKFHHEISLSYEMICLQKVSSVHSHAVWRSWSDWHLIWWVVSDSCRQKYVLYVLSALYLPLIFCTS